MQKKDKELIDGENWGGVELNRKPRELLVLMITLGILGAIALACMFY